MLKKNNAFADIAYDYKKLSELISKNYYRVHSEENTKKYRKIVEFNDGKNTERFIEYIYNTNLFPNKAKKVEIKDSDIKTINPQSYTGKEIRPKVKISYKGKKLIKNLDYTIIYKNNINIGTAKIIIKGKGIYSGKRTINFDIKLSMANCELELNEDKLVVKYNGETLSKDEDYICELVNYSEVDIEKITAIGIGKYNGRKSLLVDISSSNI